MLGWGTVLPYQYAYAAATRGWGSLPPPRPRACSRSARSRRPRGWAPGRPLLPGHRRRGGQGGRRRRRRQLIWAERPGVLPRRHVRLRPRHHRRRPGPVGPRAALGRRRRPAPRLRLAVHRPGPRHGRRRLRRRLRRRPRPHRRACGRPSSRPRPGSSSPAAFSGAPASGCAGRLGATCPSRRRVAPAARARRCAPLGVPALRWTALVTVPWPWASTPSSSPGCPPTPSPSWTWTRPRSASRPPSTASSSSPCRCVVVRLTARRSARDPAHGVGAIWTLSWLVLSAARSPRALLGAVRDDLRHLRRRRDHVRPGAQPADRQPRPPAWSARPSACSPRCRRLLGRRAARRRGDPRRWVGNLFIGPHVAISLLAVFGAWRLRRRHRDPERCGRARSLPSWP